ncbi:MAG TPA: FG-GAP-like repeat-containing protein [Thermoanaerobaculia bacterium]|nr:FG-GAP-like repeat-containing protein [Thermoanaerobaculia bacterium]
MRLRHAIIFSVLTLIAGSSFAGAIRPTGKSRDREVLVKIRDRASANDIAHLEQLADADKAKRLSKVNSGTIWHMHSRSKGAEAMAAALERNPNVEYVEPNYEVRLVATPIDPSYGQLWGLNNTGQTVGGAAGAAGADIDAQSAWNVTTGSASVVVGVVDTGIDYDHPDLQANIWTNPGGKGNVACSAGTHGFNAITGSCDPDDDHSHGTHVAGTIGAVGDNNLGVAGVNWTASIMGLKFLDEYGSGTIADAIAAIDFAVQAKIDGVNVRVLSNSWGGGPFSKALFDEINKANEHDILFVAAAGNHGADNDLYSFYPSNYPAQNMIAVAATDNRDGLAYFSNYGATKVHLAAPGVSVLSTVPGSYYGYKSGTSMATPHVAGVAALVLAKTPGLTTAQVKSAILDNTDPIAGLTGRSITGGRLNAAKAVGAPASPDFTVSVSPSSRTVARGGSVSYTVTIAPSNGFAGTVTLAATGLPSGASATFTPPSTTSSSSLLVTTAGTTPTGAYSVIVTGSSGAFQRATTATLSVVATAPPASCPTLSPQSFFTASPANALALGDFNRDGKSDLALAETGANRVSVRLGTGFGAGAHSAVGNTPLAVIAADFNADGKPDLATANSGSNNVSILTGNGDGSFQPAVHYAVGTSPFSLAAGDFDGDGAVDVAVANNGSSDVSLLLGQGDGTFAAAAGYAAGSGPFWVTVADVDRDGTLDLAVANFNADTISLLRGNGDGTFQAPLGTAAGDGPSSVAAGDLDGDGTLDLAVANHNSNNVSFLKGNGDGTFAAAVHLTVGSAPYSVAAGDLNGDGRADLVTANSGSGNVSLLLSNGDATFQPARQFATSYQPAQSVVGDLNGDGKPDVATVHQDDSYGLSILRNIGTCTVNCGTIVSAVPHGVGTIPESLATGDFNGDGKTDLGAVNKGSNNVSIALGAGDGTFVSGVTVAAGTAPHGVAAGDFNRDGRLDLAIASTGSGEVAVLSGNGDGTFQTAVEYPAGNTPRAVAAGDFDRDGRIDLAVAARGADSVAILRGSGDGTFQAPVSYSVGDAPESVAIGDFDRDGVSDLALANSASASVSVLLGNADGTFQTATSIGAGTTPFSVIAADLDGDGKPDLAVANAGSNNISLLLGNGDGAFKPAVHYAVANAPIALTAGDFNDDGLLDLATANKGGGSVSFLFAAGAGAFGAPAYSSVGTAPMAVAGADFNRDGKPDLAVANSGSALVSILLAACPAPDLAVTKIHAGTFTQGQTGKTYTITVRNAGGGATTAPVTVTDAIPAGLTATAIGGTGWTCTLSPLSCTRSGVLAGGASYPAITLTVKVATNAPATVTNTVTVSGGGELNTGNNGASDPAAIAPATDLAITKTHDGSFSQGATGRVYTLAVRNLGGLPTSGTVTVTDTLPSGLTATGLSGTGWTCSLGSLTCTRSNALAGGSQYPPIALTVTVAGNAPSPVVNVATVAGGGDAFPGNNTASDTTVVWSSQTCAAFGSPVSYPIGEGYGYAQSVAVGDFNGDGKQDFAGTDYYSGEVTVYLGLGNGTFATPAHYSVADARQVATSDMNGDGDVDLVVAGASDPAKIFILLGQGDGTFAAALPSAAGSYYLTSMAVGDLNSDGNQDVAAIGSYTSQVFVLFGNGNGTLQPAVSFSTITDGTSVAIADFDGNGTADLAVTIYYGVAILLGNGNGTFNAAVLHPADDTPNSIAVGDFNGDRRPDLAVSNSYYGVSVLLGDGDGTFETGEDAVGGYGTSSVTAEDISGDGKLDLILTNSSSYTVVTLLGDGDGTFQAANSYPAGYYPLDLAVSDFNADGRADLAIVQYYAGSIGIMLGGCPDLTITKTHSGNFRGGQTGAVYSLTVTTSGASTRGLVTVRDVLPAGLTATSMYGSGWNCDLPALTCTRSSALITGETYPINLTVNVSSAAPVSVTNTATVAGGGDVNTSNNTASDPTTIVHSPDLTIKKTHAGAFISGQTGSYTITVGNVGTGPTAGTVTVVDSLPSNMSPLAMSGTGWNCDAASGTCTRNDVLAATSTYPPITLTVTVASAFSGTVTNVATVSGGGEVDTFFNNSVHDPTQIVAAPANVVATAVSTTLVSVGWLAIPSATTYEVLRSSNNSSFAVIGNTISPAFLDNGRTPDTTYVYKIRAVHNGVAGPLSPPELATTTSFTDDPIAVYSTRIKAAHILELRTAVNAVRAAAGLAPVAFTDSTLTGVPIQAIHLTEVHDGLSAARAALGVTALPATGVGTGSVIGAWPVSTLRAGVK